MSKRKHEDDVKMSYWLIEPGLALGHHAVGADATLLSLGSEELGVLINN